MEMARLQLRNSHHALGAIVLSVSTNVTFTEASCAPDPAGDDHDPHDGDLCRSIVVDDTIDDIVSITDTWTRARGHRLRSARQ